MAAGLVLLAWASSVAQLYAGFVVLSLAWVGFGTVTAAAIVGAWFDQKRGLAIGLAFTGATCSGIFLVPGLVLLVELSGFRKALLIATTVTVVLLVPIVMAIVRFPRTQERSVEHGTQSSASMSRFKLLR
jgi:MFS family permease